MSAELMLRSADGPHKLTIERTADGRMRTTRFGISPENVIHVTDHRSRAIVELFVELVPEFARICRVSPLEVVLNSFFDQEHSEHVLFLETLHPMPESPACPGVTIKIRHKDPDIIDV